MATAPVDTPRRDDLSDLGIVHITRPPYVSALCGHVRGKPRDRSLTPSCVVCLDLFEAETGLPWDWVFGS